MKIPDKPSGKTTESLILEAACQVFLDKGLEGARMQEIADRAGINKALLHYYFRTKEKLFERVFESVIASVFPQVLHLIGSDESIPAKSVNLSLFTWIPFMIIHLYPGLFCKR